jgi:hypothetical protein
MTSEEIGGMGYIMHIASIDLIFFSLTKLVRFDKYIIRSPRGLIRIKPAIKSVRRSHASSTSSPKLWVNFFGLPPNEPVLF